MVMDESHVCGCQASTTSTDMGANTSWNAVANARKTAAQQRATDSTQKCSDETTQHVLSGNMENHKRR
jgi:hypothetical protein